jgi:hypothetical protein
MPLANAFWLDRPGSEVVLPPWISEVFSHLLMLAQVAGAAD